jgi:hypothetical protein
LTHFSWLKELLSTGYKRPFNEDDFFKISKQNESEHLSKKIEGLIEINLKKEINLNFM